MLKIINWVRTVVAEIRNSVFADPFNALKANLKSLIEDHKAIRRSLVIWAAALITWVVAQVFRDPTKITGDVVAALTTVIVLLSTSIGFYHWSRHKDDGSH